MSTKFSKEEIEKVVSENAKEISENIISQYLSALDQLDDQQKDNPVMREAACISIAVNNMNKILINSLYQLLNQ